MKIYVYLDESGSIHKNSNTKYFAVGGYLIFKEDKNKATSIYKRINKEIKDARNIKLDKELKSYDILEQEKIEIFSQIQDINTFYGVAKIFEKHLMKKEIVHSNIFFNYAVKVLFLDCIIPIINQRELKENIEFIVSVDNRNIRVGEINNLETYLKTEFCLEKFDFKITYYDSKTNFGVQLADLTVNTFYNCYKDKRIVKKLMNTLKQKNFRVSSFPSIKTNNKSKKNEYNLV